jgi:23S rRNA-/tRNA-specific pseudouridylate synthase
MIMANEAVKHYLALVEGCITLPGALTSPVPTKGRCKSALTRFHPIANAGDYTLLDLELLTGRHHQIRHQLATANRPIVGDSRYSGTTIDGLGRLFLHCHQLTFRQPITEQKIEIICPLPGELRALLRQLGFAPDSFIKHNA